MSSRAGHRADHTSPLRTVITEGVGLDPDPAFYVLPRLLLACGHVARRPYGAWGADYTPGTRRRCAKCAEGLPPERLDWVPAEKRESNGMTGSTHEHEHSHYLPHPHAYGYRVTVVHTHEHSHTAGHGPDERRHRPHRHSDAQRRDLYRQAI